VSKVYKKVKQENKSILLATNIIIILTITQTNNQYLSERSDNKKSRKNKKISLSVELNICYTLIDTVDELKRLFTVGRHAPSGQTVM